MVKLQTTICILIDIMSGGSSGYTNQVSFNIVESESEAGKKIGGLDFYKIEGGERKSEVLKDPFLKFKVSCV